jgi:hypothetical protein
MDLFLLSAMTVLSLVTVVMAATGAVWLGPWILVGILLVALTALWAHFLRLH